jgi:hypothetical protein
MTAPTAFGDNKGHNKPEKTGKRENFVTASTG